jgi:hypothetical protein
MSLLRAATEWFVEPADDAAVAESPPDGRTRAGTHPLDTAAAPDRTWLGGPRAPAAPRLRLAPTAPVDTGVQALLRVAVVGAPASAPALAAAVALSCRARARTSTALVALWRSPGVDGPPPGPAAPALPGAGALAARLRRRDLPATARGRLVWLLLPGEPDAAVPALRHAEAAAGDVPVVLAVARPREPLVDAVLAERDLAIVAAAPGSPLAEAVLADADDLRVPARACAPLPPGAARLAALAGLAAPRLETAW